MGWIALSEYGTHFIKKGGRLTSAFFYYRSRGFDSSGEANGFSLLIWS
ncbi:hypothetical protein IEQ_03345 [Bacillus cereus BAG6X1-2]|nr:hypothetical protein IEQ_03345 [Bacillus cereus BAG6X1-2]